MEMANVLYDATLWRRELVRLLVRLHVPATYPAFFHRWERDYLVDVERGFRQYEEAFQAFLLSAGLSWGQIDEIEAVARCQRQAYEENVRPLPAVGAALAALTKRGLPLVALCDACQPAAVLERRDRAARPGGRIPAGPFIVRSGRGQAGRRMLRGGACRPGIACR